MASDASRFTCQEAFRKYQRSARGQKIIPERGLQVCPTSEPDIAKIIADRGWESLVASPAPAIVPIVREFYANAVVGYEHVYVRGLMVPFDSKSINAVYNLPDIINDDFSTALESDVNLGEVIRTLCKPGAAWKKVRGVEVSFPTSALTTYSKTWMRFIWAKLMPSTRANDIPKNKAIFLYSILSGRSIDIGKVMHSSIVHSSRIRTTIGLCLPSLICTLCMRAGVLWAPYEEVQSPRCAIDHRMIKRYKKNEIIDTPAEVESSTGRHSVLLENTAMVERIRQIETRLDCLSRSLDTLISYIASSQENMTHGPNQFSGNFGMPTMQLSTPLTQPQDRYPPESHEDPGSQPWNFHF